MKALVDYQPNPMLLVAACIAGFAILVAYRMPNYRAYTAAYRVNRKKLGFWPAFWRLIGPPELFNHDGIE